MKKIWFDIGHIAQYNFYKNTILRLAEKFIVIITVLERGKLLTIIKSEIPLNSNIIIVPVGVYKYTKRSVIIDNKIIRFFKLISFFVKYKPDILIENGFLASCVARMFFRKSIQFGDDPEAKDYLFKYAFSSELYYAMYESNLKKVQILKALKEWAYLSIDDFCPNINILKQYELETKKYIFVRDVITTSFNYVGQLSDKFIDIGSIPNNYKVVLSLEDKSKINQVPKGWIILNEPVEDIHSLLYYSKIVISTGDSMAREGAILGVPSIYCGIREMNAISVLKEYGMIHHCEFDKVLDVITKIINHYEEYDQLLVRNLMNKNWINVSDFVIERIEANI